MRLLSAAWGCCALLPSRRLTLRSSGTAAKQPASAPQLNVSHSIKMFSWFIRRKKKEQLRQLFSEYVSPEMLKAAAASEFSKPNVLSEGPVEFVFAVVHGTTANETGQLLGLVATVAQQNGWMVQGFLCNLVVLVRGTLPVEEPLALKRSALVDKLLQAMASNIKIVHGLETASFGNMGCSARLTYGVLLPSFFEILSVLNLLPYGQSHEYHG